MSHASGVIRFQDGTFRFFEYDGTSDLVRPKLYSSPDDLRDHWREDYDWDACKCKCGKATTAEAHASYGSGMVFEVVACPHCNTINSPCALEHYNTGKPLWVDLARGIVIDV